MFLTMAVPASVPSVAHSSWPLVPSFAEKYILSLKMVQKSTLANPLKAPLPDPGHMSLTMAVPASVPSVAHSSLPLVPSSAHQYTLSLKTVGLDWDGGEGGRLCVGEKVRASAVLCVLVLGDVTRAPRHMHPNG